MTTLTTDRGDEPRAAADVRVEPVTVTAVDGVASRGLLYHPPRASTVVSIMHPREDLSQHYLVPYLVNAGYAVWAQNSRSVGNDVRLVHEQLLLDAGAGIAELRRRGFDRVVLVGTSGGGGLYAFYLQQAGRPPDDRISRTPARRPTRLAEADLPPADALVLLAAHPGQAALLRNCIDPSVVDESDPFSVDPELDPFSPSNGFGPVPRYDPEFVARYRAAQAARIARIDELALSWVARKAAARRNGGPASLFTPIFTVWRTDADLRTLDVTLDPSDRPPGSVWGRPERSNLGPVGFGRLATPDAWLSTWSVHTGNAVLARTAPDVHVPTLVVRYTGDTVSFPEETAAVAAALGTSDVTTAAVRGDHRGNALRPGEPSGRPAAAQIVLGWLDGR